MTNYDVDTLVVGAGPTGLTLACELARHNVRFRIIDKLSIGSDKSKALAVHSRSLEMLEDMGIVDRFITHGLRLHGVNVFADNKQIAKLSLDELDSFYSYTLSLPQSDTERLLMERLSELNHSVERSMDLFALEQFQDGVEATVKNGAGEIEKIRARWVVGADGAHSAVRKLLKMGFVGSKYPDLMKLTDVHIEGHLTADEIYVFNSEKGLIALFPYGGNRYRIAAVSPEQEDHEHEADANIQTQPSLEEMQKIVDERVPLELKLSDQHWSTGLYLHARHVTKYREGNCFLAGDAAHIHSPAGGQGMNTGMQDSYNLAWKMGLVAKGVASDGLLDSYNDERLGIALGVLKMTDFMMRVNTMKNPVAKQLRNTFAPILTAQEVIQTRIKNSISELSLNYGDSLIVEEHFAPVTRAIVHQDDMPTVTDIFAFKDGPGAGDRAPDGFLQAGREEPVRLYEVIKGTKHSLLLFSGDDTSDSEIEKFQTIATNITKLYKQFIDVIVILDSMDSVARCTPKLAALKETVRTVADWEMATHHKYAAGSNCAYLIRPDCYVGFRSQPMDESLLTTYLNRIFDKVLTKI